MRRRDFLRATAAGPLVAALPPAFPEQAGTRAAADGKWYSSSVRHLLSTVSDTQVLVKASFVAPLAQPPTLRIGSLSVPGLMSDTRGEMWAFHASEFAPGRPYTLTLTGTGGRSLCQPWEFATFPSPDARPEHLRVLFFTCAGGHEDLAYLPTAIRSRLLRRALSLRPDAIDFHRGDVRGRAVSGPYISENTSDHAIRILEVDLKGPPAGPAVKSALDAVAVDPKHFKGHFENDAVRVLRVHYDAHDKSQSHEHVLNRVILYLNDSVVGKMEEVRTSGPRIHVEENDSDQPADAIAVELK